MISKQTIENIVSKQWKSAEEAPAGFSREVTQQLPYLSDKALLLGGIRGSGCSTLLRQMLHGDYIKAWYADFEDPRLAGFDEGDFTKLSHLISESGRGVLLLDRIDLIPGWHDFVRTHLDKGIKVVAAVSLRTLREAEASNSKASNSGTADSAPSRKEAPRNAQYETRRVDLLSYNEFMEATRRRPSEAALQEYIQRGAFPVHAKLRELYDETILRDVILAGGVRDRATLQRIALRLIDSCGETVSANALRNQLKVKAVSTVTEHFDLLARAGLFDFVPIYSDTPSRQAVNPRKVYPADPALAQALTTTASLSREKLFEAAVFRYLKNKYDDIYYTSTDGGCDFVVCDKEGEVSCVQACCDHEDIDLMQIKTEGLAWAASQTDARNAIIVTLAMSDTFTHGDRTIELVDADTLFSGDSPL